GAAGAEATAATSAQAVSVTVVRIGETPGEALGREREPAQAYRSRAAWQRESPGRPSRGFRESPFVISPVDFGDGEVEAGQRVPPARLGQGRDRLRQRRLRVGRPAEEEQ